MTQKNAELTETRFDLVDRFEHVIGLQVAVLEDIATKAGHITRLAVLVLGLVLSTLSIVVRQDTTLAVTLPTVVAFELGVTGLVTSLAGAIVTYLNTKIKLGVHPSSAVTLEEASIGRNEYGKLLVGSYADVLKANSSVLDVNVNRLRYTLAALVFGICHLVLAILQHVALDGKRGRWLVLGLGLVATLGICGLVLSGRFLVLEGE